LLPEFTALENVAMPLLISKVSPGEALEKASELLEAVGLSARVEHKPSELSGGERQRTAIARAMVTNPACVLADEPTGNLDQKTAADVFELMKQTNQRLNSGLVIVTHDLSIARQMQKGYTLNDGHLKRQW
jgi:lipoprotein-releasing system ATP-binding protein